MKDFRGREVVIGATVIYAVTGGLTVATVEDVNGDKVTLRKEDGKTTTTAWKDAKAVLVSDPTMLA